MDVLERVKFEMVISKAIAKKNEEDSGRLVYDKDQIWKAVNDGKDTATTIEFAVLEKWLGFKN